MIRTAIIAFCLLICCSALCAQQLPSAPNQVDEQGRRTGRWIIYLDNDLRPLPDATGAAYYQSVDYSAGTPTQGMKLFFRTGKLYFQCDSASCYPDTVAERRVSFWYDNNFRQRELSYREGLPNGKAVFWDAAGNPSAKGEYKDGMMHGHWRIRLPGYYWSEGEYQLDMREGPWTITDRFGNLSEKGLYASGMRTGVWESYFPTGELQNRGPYTDDTKEGMWREYSRDRSYAEGNYHKDLRDGQWTYFDAQSNRLASGFFRNGKREGSWQQFDTDGKLSSTNTYINGILQQK